MNLQNIIRILEENINRVEKCKEHDCNISKQFIIAIYSPENNGLKKKSVKSELTTSDGNYKACDCIVVCEDGYIYIIEILCGTLTKEEFEDKVKQIENCIRILRILNLYDYLAFSFIIFKKKDKFIKKYFQQKLTKLNKKRISAKPYNEIDENFPYNYNN